MKILVAKNDSKDGHPFKGLRYYAFFDPKTMGWSEPTKFTIPIDEEDRPELGLPSLRAADRSEDRRNSIVSDPKYGL
jgi:hypothetical protein